LHTDLGHRTRGAKVNGSIVPLNYKLQNGQRVEILTSKIGSPSRDWLSPTLGYLQSNRARAKVRQWFKMQNFDENVAQGRAQLDKELHRLGITSVNQEKVAQRLHFNKLEDLLAAIGRSEITQRQLASAIQDELPGKTEEIRPIIQRVTTTPKISTGVLVEGVGNLLTKTAQCCHPQPPDEIVGYVTRDRGITLHRKDCRAIQRIPENRRDRMLDAQWGSQGDAFVLAKVRATKNIS
jgi:GTP pyrophosphokinase